MNKSLSARRFTFARTPELSEEDKAEILERKEWLKPSVRTRQSDCDREAQRRS